MSNINYFDYEELCKDGKEREFEKYLTFFDKAIEEKPKDRMVNSHNYDKKQINDLLNKLQGDDVHKYIIASIIGCVMGSYERSCDAWVTLEKVIIDDIGKKKYDHLVGRMLAIESNKFAEKVKCPELMRPIAKFTIVPKKED